MLPSNAFAMFCMYPFPPVEFVFVSFLLFVAVPVNTSYSVFPFVTGLLQSSMRFAVSVIVFPRSNFCIPVGLVYDAFMSANIWIFCMGLLLYVYDRLLFTSTYHFWSP